MTAIEQELWKAAEVRSVTEIPGFPFESHQALLKAIRTGQATLGVEPAAARGLTHITASAVRTYFLQALMWTPFLLAIGSVVLPFTHGNWLAAAGLVTAPVGMLLSSPYNPLKRFIYAFSVAALVYSLFAGSVFGGLRWAMFCFAASYLVIRGVNALARDWAVSAVLSSEAVTAYLYKAGNLFIQDSNGVMHSPRFSQPRAGNRTPET
jgi:hypothetical protein